MRTIRLMGWSAMAAVLSTTSCHWDVTKSCDELGSCGAYEAPGAGGVGGGGTTGGSAGLNFGGAPNWGGEGGGGAECSGDASPNQNTCVIDSEYGVFVSPTGDDEAAGTQEEPVATLAHAIELAVESGKRVYACNTEGAFAEALELNEEAAGVAIYGGFDCDTWAYDAETKARIEPNSPQPFIATGADGLELHDLEIVAADATEAGASSIALQLLDTDADLVRVVLTAGNGAAGEQRVREDFTYPAIGDLKGCDASSDDGYCANSQGGRCSYTCPAGDETSGGTRGGPSGDGGPGFPDRSANAGEFVAPDCQNGGKGENGPAGSNGSGAAVHGTLDETGWTPAHGEDGGPGEVGQGGGGGSGGDGSGIGGGGGCGGCGGAGARGSTGGGSSIALLIYNSAATVTECALTTATGGDGGAAQEGQEGQYDENVTSRAGAAGAPENTDACPGGAGGIGGNGGASGGGAGGLSVGIVYTGTEPTLDDPTTNAITTGEAGDGGAAVPGNSDTKGLDGVTETTLDVS